jgi:hypothetical protein
MHVLFVGTSLLFLGIGLNLILRRNRGQAL